MAVGGGSGVRVWSGEWGGGVVGKVLLVYVDLSYLNLCSHSVYVCLGVGGIEAQVLFSWHSKICRSPPSTHKGATTEVRFVGQK